MTDKNFTPYDSQEYSDWKFWKNQAEQGELETYQCIAAWSDICGFGSALEQAHWNLQKVKESGLFRALSRTYSILGRPFIIGVPPMPTDRVLVINDGVARTTDLTYAAHTLHESLLFYVRDLLMHHFILERQLVQYGLGLRTVLAGGERCQYSSQKSTGQSFLHYTNEPSGYGKALLEQQFVYNPAEFQMNTAFALAYTLESLGSARGIIPNRVYIEESWLAKLNAVLPEPTVIKGQEIHFPWRGEPGVSIAFDDCIEIVAKGLSANVFRVREFVVHEQFEGERTEFPMFQHDRQNV